MWGAREGMWGWYIGRCVRLGRDLHERDGLMEGVANGCSSPYGNIWFCYLMQPSSFLDILPSSPSPLLPLLVSFVPHRLFESIHLGQTSRNVDQAWHSCDPKYQGPSSDYHQSRLLPLSVLGSHGPVLCSHSWQVVWINWRNLAKLVTLHSFQTAYSHFISFSL